MKVQSLRGLPWLMCIALGCTSSRALPAPTPADVKGEAHEEPEAEADSADSDAPSHRPPGLARNVIVFMADGMGPEQLSTGRYESGGPLRIDEMAGPAFVSTDSLTTLNAADPELAATDSAAAATVIATGVRVANDVLSVSPLGAPLETVLEACKKADKATGLVTTSYFFDASPAAFAVHQGSRGSYEAIVRQMLSESQPDVIMGNGGWLFDDPQYQLGALAEASDYLVVRGVAELMTWDPEAQPRLLGLFTTDFVPEIEAVELYSMTPALVRREDSPDPSLATMTARALERLAQDPDGFFLFAEDELFDEMGHRGPAEVAWVNRAYPQQVLAFDEAVAVAIDWVHSHSSFEETLIVVLADHETGGYRYDHALGPESGTFSAFSEGAEYPVGNHTRTPTAVYALGPGSDSISQLEQHADTHQLLVGALP